MEEFFDIAADIIAINESIWFNFNEYNKFHPAVKSPDEELAETLKQRYPGHSIGRLAPIMTRLRIIKETEEITRIREACQITEHAFRQLLPVVRPEMMEYEIDRITSYNVCYTKLLRTSAKM